LVLFGVPFVEYDAVAGLQGQFASRSNSAQLGIDFDDDVIVRDGRDSADANPAMFRKPSLNEFLMIDAPQETMREAAGKTLCEIELLLMRNFKGTLLDGCVDRRAICLRRCRDVMG